MKEYKKYMDIYNRIENKFGFFKGAINNCILKPGIIFYSWFLLLLLKL